MLDGVHLRVVGRLRNVLLMAARANDGCIRQSGNQRRRIFRVLRERAMAGFAIHVDVFAMTLGLGDIGMAGFARLVARVVDRTRGDFIEGRTAIMAVFTECLGNQCSTHGKKSDEDSEENSSQPEEMA